MVHDYGSDVNNPNIEYSTNYGRTWTTWNGSTIQLSDEQIILFRGLNPDGFNNYNGNLYSNFTIGGSGTIQAYGSVMSLIDQIGELLTIPSNDIGGCFYQLFHNCTKLVKDGQELTGIERDKVLNELFNIQDGSNVPTPPEPPVIEVPDPSLDKPSSKPVEPEQPKDNVIDTNTDKNTNTDNTGVTAPPVTPPAPTAPPEQDVVVG